jgi:hypothetical protein
VHGSCFQPLLIIQGHTRSPRHPKVLQQPSDPRILHFHVGFFRGTKEV